MRFGLLGTGWWADHVHAAALASHPVVEFVGVWGRDAAKAAAVAGRHSTIAERDLDALLGKVDAVTVAVPPDVQAELACRAAEAGCHLLLEKPLALSPAAAGRVVAAAERAGVASLVAGWGFTRGEPVASWYRDVVTPGRWHGGSAYVAANLFQAGNPFGSSPWRAQHGALWDAGAHAVDALLPALGPVAEVAAGRGHGDTVQLLLRHAPGGVSSVTVSLTAPQEASGMHVELWGQEGIVRSPRPDPGRAPDAMAQMSRQAIDDLVSASESCWPHERDVHFGDAVVRVLAAAERFLHRPAERRCERLLPP